MKLVVDGQGLPVGPVERERVSRQLRFALARFGDRVRQATVLLRQVGAEDGEPCHWCRVTVELTALGPLTHEDADADLTAAIERAAARAGQAVERRLLWVKLFPELAGPPDGRKGQT